MQAQSIAGPTVWLAAAYWSLTIVSTIGFGDVLPYTNAERGVMLLAQLAGVLWFGIVLGSVTSLLQVSPLLIMSRLLSYQISGAGSSCGDVMLYLLQQPLLQFTEIWLQPVASAAFVAQSEVYCCRGQAGKCRRQSSSATRWTVCKSGWPASSCLVTCAPKSGATMQRWEKRHLHLRASKMAALLC